MEIWRRRNSSGHVLPCVSFYTPLFWIEPPHFPSLIFFSHPVKYAELNCIISTHTSSRFVLGLYNRLRASVASDIRLALAYIL